MKVSGHTVGEVLSRLGEMHREVQSRILDTDGGIRAFVNVYIGERNVRALEGLASPVTDGDVVSIVPAVAGGAS